MWTTALSRALVRPRAAFIALLALLSLCACTPKPEFRNADITGADYARDFSLTDHTGTHRTLADYRGKVVAMYFGYTQCPDVCPTTMVEMLEVMRLLGDQADRLQVLFVTVDPERDTQALLGMYVPAFHPSFVGLRGTPQEVAKTAADYRVHYQRVPGSTPDSYTIDHFAGMYLYDPAGKLRLFVRYGQRPDAIAQDVKTLLTS